MRPIRTARSNFTYLGPTPAVADLPCQRQPGQVRSVWELTDLERTMIANGAQICLGILTEPIPPVSLSIINEPERPDPDDLRCQLCDGLYVKSRRLTKCGWCGGELVATSPPERDPINEDPPNWPNGMDVAGDAADDPPVRPGPPNPPAPPTPKPCG